MVFSAIDAVRADMQCSDAYARADRVSIGRQKFSLAVMSSRLQVLIGGLVRQRSALGGVHLLLVLSQELLVDLSGRGSQGRGSDELLNA